MKIGLVSSSPELPSFFWLSPLTLRLAYMVDALQEVGHLTNPKPKRNVTQRNPIKAKNQITKGS